MTKKILIMGLPGAGKTTLATEMTECLQLIGRTVDWFNADVVRKQYDDWDFSPEGRIRQSLRMRDLAVASAADFVICDFVAALPEQRSIMSADYVIWVHTEEQGRFEDTNQAFVAPSKYNFYVDTKDAPTWSSDIIKHLLLLEKHERKI